MLRRCLWCRGVVLRVGGIVAGAAATSSHGGNLQGVAFEPLEYPREEDSHAYGVTTKEELLDWVKNGDQTYRDLLVPVCVLASSPSSAFCYKSYADFFLIILDFCIAVASVWPQTSANRSLIQVGLIRPGRNGAAASVETKIRVTAPGWLAWPRTALRWSLLRRLWGGQEGGGCGDEVGVAATVRAAVVGAVAVEIATDEAEAVKLGGGDRGDTGLQQGVQTRCERRRAGLGRWLAKSWSGWMVVGGAATRT
ncbi:hypothetical protein EDB85DRAFT_1890180 [Lactarius pseudohatsudake]|nr:hypothetical protein EDB85DRAFT_1890180 [Lactarius pseudohatsudake]